MHCFLRRVISMIWDLSTNLKIPLDIPGLLLHWGVTYYERKCFLVHLYHGVVHKFPKAMNIGVMTLYVH